MSTLAGCFGDCPLAINGRFLAQPQSGVQRFAREITGALLALDPSAVVLAPPDTPADAGTDLHAGRLRRVGTRRGQAWEQLDLPRHVGGAFLLNLGNTAPLRLRRQAVVIHDAGWAITPAAYSRAFRLSYAASQTVLTRGGARLLTVSVAARADIARTLRIDPQRLAVISEGAEHIARLVPDASVLDRAGLAPGRYVLAVGNTAAHKNLVALAPLARALAARGAVLAIAGALPARGFAAGAGLPEGARSLGRVTDAHLHALYRHAACLVFPSRYEGFGLPAVEAMACLCPVVAADIPALRETCGAAARYADPCDPAAITAAVLALLDAPDAADRLRAAGRRHARDLTWERAARLLLAALGRRVPAAALVAA